MKRNSWIIIATVLVILLVPLIDFDGDQLSTYSEILTHSTNAFNSDSDYDQLNDGAELLRYNTNPKTSDTDSDGLSDGEEVNNYLTDPTLTDIDNDSLSDGKEVKTYNTDPTLTDTDGDGLTDDYELKPKYLGGQGAGGSYCSNIYYPGSDPTNPDTYGIGKDSNILHRTHSCISPYCGDLVTNFC